MFQHMKAAYHNYGMRREARMSNHYYSREGLQSPRGGKHFVEMHYHADAAVRNGSVDPVAHNLVAKDSHAAMMHAHANNLPVHAEIVHPDTK